ncbi:tetratricopeptide repeat protein [Lentisphaerota bacterium ZTH]|nr:sel1 repeat family protein [Lentisphaerota bacterium]WET06347.1 tetratricopeptide repeat protein [Lentisphaerota bacterium ZTH]
MNLSRSLKKIAPALLAILSLTGCMSLRERSLSEAQQGDPTAQAIIGSMYMTGEDSKISYKDAHFWLRKSAAQGNCIALYYLGMMYEYGLGDVTPDRARAKRFYEMAFNNVHKRAKDGEIRYINILAEMYHYGRGTAVNQKASVELFKYCAQKGYTQATASLGVIRYTGNGIAQDIAKAKNLLLRAAEEGDPRAEFFLSEVYYGEQKNIDGLNLLQKSSRKGYPPAMFKMALKFESGSEVKADASAAKKLFLAAANAGYAPAQLRVSEYYPDRETKLAWIKQASERSFVPAMLAFAEIIKSGVDSNPAKIMILYQLALKIKPGDRNIIKKVVELDSTTGLYFPIKFCWHDIDGGESLLLSDSDVYRVIRGYKAGIKSGSSEIFKKALAKNPLPFYMNNDWYLLYQNRMPQLWSSSIFKAVEKTESQNAGYWLGYGIAAGLAGQGGSQAFAAYNIKKMAEPIINTAEGKMLNDLSALLKANSLVLLGRSDDAYNFLFTHGRLNFNSSPYMINFVNNWCGPLLKNKNKLSVASGIEKIRLGEYSFPQTQEFFDLQYDTVVGEKPLVNEPAVDLDVKAAK